MQKLYIFTATVKTLRGATRYGHIRVIAEHLPFTEMTDVGQKHATPYFVRLIKYVAILDS